MNAMEDDIFRERYELAAGRIEELVEELTFVENEYLAVDTTEFFATAACYLLEILENGNKREMPYENSYLNPMYATAALGMEHGRILSWLLYELCSLEPFVKAGCMQDIVIRLELFLEVYAAYTYEWRENGQLPEYEAIRRIMYWFAFDYADVAAEQYVKELASGAGEGLYLNSASMLYGFVPGVGSCRKEEHPFRTRCEADHGADLSMILDRAYISRRLEVFRTALERIDPIKVQIGNCEEESFGDLEGFSAEQKKFLQEYCRQMKKYVAHLA